MKKIFGFTSRVNEKELSLSDAFCEYLNDNYFPDALETLDADTINFEYNNFFNAYAK